ncbi:MAG: substrate-binding domain-containing protein [Lentisphaerae bacterium]|jgi:ribose transport system substrate-binding protein|nr:substrate-binding domain-containing protein [Lentisphaerota bacterium]
MKNLALALIPALLCTAVLLSGCSRDESSAAKTTHRIGISIPSADHGWTGGVVYHANRIKKEIEKENPDTRVIVSTAATSGEQVDRIENLIVQKIDALVILPSEPAPLTGICKKAVEQGIKLIVVDRNLADPIQHLAVVGDNPGFGRAAAEVIAKELDGKGEIVIMEGVQCDVNTQRIEAFKEVLSEYPEMKIIGSGSADWNTEKGLALMENFLQKHPRIDAVWTGDDDVSIGALKAYEESKRNDTKVFVGGGGSREIIKRIIDKDPLVRITVTYPPEMIAVAAQEAVKIIKGAEIEKDLIVVPAVVVDSSNAAEHYHPDSAY